MTIKNKDNKSSKFIHYDCPICLGIINDKYTTQCGHNFCKHCLDEWLINHTTCPMCRTKLKINNMHQYLLSGSTGFSRIDNEHNNMQQYLPSGSINFSRMDDEHFSLDNMNISIISK